MDGHFKTAFANNIWASTLEFSTYQRCANASVNDHANPAELEV